MGIIEIIKIIMSILAFIAGLFAPKTGVREVAYVTDFDCDSVEWTAPATVSGGAFSGTAQVVCRFEGKAGGGILALRAHMEEQLPADGARGEAQVENYQGLPSLAYATQVDMGGAVVHGTTHIATNGFTILRNTFESSRIEATGNGKYLQSAFADMQVTATDEAGVYEVRMSQSMRVKKPSLVSSSSFLSSLKSQAEETLMDRTVGAIQEMASHL